MAKRLLAGIYILEQTDFPKFLLQEFVARIAQQLLHVRIDVADSPRGGIENEYPVSRAFKETPVTSFRNLQRFRHLQVLTTHLHFAQLALDRREEAGQFPFLDI